MLVAFLVLSNFATAQTTKSVSDSITVHVSFVVDKTGEMTKIKARNVDCTTCTRKQLKSLKKAAEKLVSKMPKFDPNDNNKYYMLPVVVVMEEE